MSESVLRIVIDSRNAEQNARNLSRELNSIEKNGDFATKSMDSMSVATRNLAGYMAGIITVSGAIAKADGYTQMAARIRNATQGAEEYELVQNRLLETANITYRALSEAQEVYLSLAGGMKSLGFQTQETLDLSDSLSFSFTHNATRADQAQSAMDSLSKSMAKGGIDADAWISIVTGADNIIADMAKTTGKSEAEIRKLGATGKASLEDLIKTLIATREQNEKLANNMENSLADGMTVLSNAVTVYLGKANEATSATGLMASGLGMLANNLESVANVAMLGGVAYLTKAIIMQSVATQGAITKSIQRRASLQAEMVAHTQALGLEVQRTRQISALAAQELRMAQLALVNAKNKDAQAIATVRLAQAEVAYGLAIKQSSAAVAVETVAQNTLNASRAIGARMLTLAGGWTGVLTIGVTALAAGYMYLSGKVEDSTESLRANNESVEDAIKSYSELDGVKKRQQQSSEKASLKELGEAYDDATDKLNTNAYALTRHNDITREQAKELNGLISEFKQTGNLDLFSDKINKLSFISLDSKDKFNTLAGATKDAGTEFKNQKQFVDAITGSLNSTANAGHNAAAGVNDATNALSEYAKQARDVGRQAEITNKLLAKGYSQDVASDLAEVAAKNGKVTAQEAEAIIYKNKELTKLNATMESQRKAQQAPAKAEKSLASQQKKEAKDLEVAQRERNELLKESQQILYEYGTEYARIEHDVTNEIKRISESVLKSSDKSGLISEAKALGEARKKLYALELEENLYGWNWTEEQRLTKTFEIAKARIRSTKGATDQLKKIQIDAIDSQHKHELALIELAKEERIFQMQQGLMHANAASEKYWNLERERIVLSVQYLTERNRQLAIANELQAKEKFDNLSSAAKEWGSINAGMTGQGDQWQLQQEDDSRAKASEELLLAELDLANTAEQREAIWQAHHDRMSMIESAYQQDSLNMQLTQAQAVTGALTGMFGVMLGESSSSYRAMFEMQRMFALSKAGINLWESASDAYAKESGTVWQKMGAAAQATLDQGTFIAMIQAATSNGFESGGYTGSGGRKDVAGVVHGQEYVLNAQATKRVGVGTLDAINSGKSLGGGGGNVTINQSINIASDGTATTQNDSKQLAALINNAVLAVIRKEQRQGGLLS